MNTEQTQQPSVQISQEKLLSFVRAMIGGSRGREDDEHPLPPGPWDPVIRVALQSINVFGPRPEPWKLLRASPEAWGSIGTVFGPSPEPWRVIFARHPEIWDAIGGGGGFGSEVALNPQPLPPRFAFLLAVAQAVVTRAELMQEIADATRREGEQQGIIIVGGYLARFVDDFCGNGFRLKYPFPGPRPHWFAKELTGIDLVVVATQFEQAAKEAFSGDLRRHLSHAGARLTEAGLSKMQ